MLLLDEPAAGLDPAHQIAVMARLRDLARQGKGILVSLHDLTLAARYCNRLILLQDGEIRADGPPESVLTPESLAEIFGLQARLIETPNGLLVDGVIATQPVR